MKAHGLEELGNPLVDADVPMRTSVSNDDAKWNPADYLPSLLVGWTSSFGSESNEDSVASAPAPTRARGATEIL